MDQNSNIQLGLIQGVFGIKGWFKVFSYCRPKEQILNYATWQLLKAEETHTYRVENGKQHGNGIITKLKGIDTRTQAEKLVGAEIWVSKEDLLELLEGDYYWFQLTGLKVFTTDGEYLGTVTRLLETGANDVLVIANESAEEILIPYIKDEVVKSVDLNQKLITVAWQADYI